MESNVPVRASARRQMLFGVLALPFVFSLAVVLLFAGIARSQSASQQETEQRRMPANPFRSGNSTSPTTDAGQPRIDSGYVSPSADPSRVPGAQQPLNQPTPLIAPSARQQQPFAPDPSASAGTSISGNRAAQPSADSGAATASTGSALANQGYDAGAARTAIGNRITSVQEATELDDVTKSEALKRLNKALESLDNAAESIRRAGVFEAELNQGGQRINDLRALLATPTREPALENESESQLKLLEQRLVEAETELAEAKEDLAKREEALNRRSERSAELTKLISDTKKRVEEAQKQLAAPPAAGENEVLTEARRWELEARIYAAERQRHLLETESKRSEALAELFPLERDQANRLVNYLTKEVAARQKQVTERRKLESERQAMEARRQVENALPGLRELAERNAELADMRSNMASSIEKLEGEVQSLQEQLADLNDELTLTREKLARSSHSSAMGLMLRKQRDELPDLEACQQRLRFVKREIPRVQLFLLELSDERAPLSNIDEMTESIVGDLGTSANGFGRENVRAMVAEMLATRREFLDSLRDDYDTYVRDLSELELTTSELSRVGSEFRSLIDEHILWIRSDEPLTPTIAKNAVTRATALLDPRGWASLPSIAANEVRRIPGLAVLCIAMAALCFLLNGRLRSRFEKSCQAGAKRGELAFLPTLEGLAIIAILSGQVPALLLFVSWRLRVAVAANAFSDGFAAALYFSAILIWVSRFARCLLRPNGLAALHFEWPESIQKGMRRNLFWFTWILLPFGCIVAFAQAYGDGELVSSLGRVAFIFCAVIVAVFAHRVFRPGSRFYRDLHALNDGSMVYRFRHVAYAVLMGAPLVLCVLSIMGYYYSVTQLVARLQWSVAATGVLAIVHAVASRWFVVKRRNLSIRQARDRLAAQQDETGNSPPPDRDTVQAELSEIHNQLRYLLRNALIVGGVLAACFIWYDVLPALKVFDRVQLWSKSIEVSEVVEQPDGTQEVETKDQVISITLRHALIAVLMLIATYMLGLNLPALLQVTILERLPIDHGGRHAIGVIIRYVVTLVGTILACRTLHISWGSVQWLAAAITVGLGFGMQEIFANFVSGLIILFERPVRVGDLVTVGGVTGRVTRTQIRATTITDFDRRELIVPNKKFITDDVMNWTLSDHVNRVVIEVGVAYGSDTKRVREILLEVANDNAEVLDDPAAVVTFDRFADSWLNFTLRCFLPNMDNRLAVIHDLHFAIDQAFRAESITIAFPQQDVHVHGLDKLASRLNDESRSARSDAA